jgi:hypothetical protein
VRRRRRRMGRLELFYSMVITGLLISGSASLDRHGVAVSGRVTGKQERVVVGHEPSGDWRRFYEVATAFERPGGGSSQATVRVPLERYDSLRIGDTIEVRYLPQFPLLARTSDRSTVRVMSELAWGLAGIAILEWLVGGFLALWVAARMGTIPVLAVGAAWIAVSYPLLLSPPSRERPRNAEATAQVRGITLVDKSPERISRTRHRTSGFNRRLKVPYQVVELAVPVPGGSDTVIAVDAVDSGSVAGLAYGARLPVRLDPATPREAQLAVGTRRFVEANRYHFLIPVVGFGILGTLGGLTYRWRRRKRQTNAREETMSRQGTAIATGALLLLFGTGTAAAQAQATGTPDDALDAPCALLTSAEVNQATGRRDYEDGMPMGVRSAEFDGASVCSYGFAEMAFDPSETPPLITVAIAAARLGESSVEQLLREGPRTGCKRETVPDVGQVAFVEACAEDITLHAHVAPYELLVAINYMPSMSQAASDAALLTLAKAAAARLRDW